MGNVTVHPVAGRIGAEIHGVDIAEPLSEHAKETIQDALNVWKVVFFRDQHLDHATQIEFGRQFGELTYAHPHDDTPPEEYPEIYTVDSRRFTQRFNLKDDEPVIRKYSYTSGWHTDVTPEINPPAGSILRADIIPPYGGDTSFTNLVAAYEGLSAPVRAFVDTLRAEHRYGANWSGLPRQKSGYSELIEKNALVSSHPVVRVHPFTGERALFVNPVFVDHVKDVNPIESRWILGQLFEELTRPEYTVRFRWQPGSVAFWDNRATSHLGPQDLGHLDVERVLHRVTLIGEVPVGPDGRESELIEGVPFRSSPVFAAAGSLADDDRRRNRCPERLARGSGPASRDHRNHPARTPRADQQAPEPYSEAPAPGPPRHRPARGDRVVAAAVRDEGLRR
jgi:alpha-ketoglutarate-dependent sulfate ester dioxygenase